MANKAKIAFLYSEIAGYTVACLKSLSLRADVLLIRWPVNSEAPFQFIFPENVTVVDRKGMSVDEIYDVVAEFKPDKIACSGWMDKDYLKVIKRFKKQIPLIVTIDNHWEGSIKQIIASIISPFYIKKLFTHAWVPGEPQYKFAQKLGFASDHIEQGFYCADTELFTQVFNAAKSVKEKSIPKRILYVARYVEHKGIFEMWNAFIEWQKQSPNEWELWCVGAGEEWENRVEHEKIKHFGFLQPNEMTDVIKETGVYILPSKFEPWGVTVQEFAVAGYPLLISKNVGAATAFCKAENGLIFKAGNEEEMLEIFKKIERLSQDQLLIMSEASHTIGLMNTPDIWSDKLLNFKL